MAVLSALNPEGFLLLKVAPYVTENEGMSSLKLATKETSTAKTKAKRKTGDVSPTNDVATTDKKSAARSVDPLYIIFEQHLFNFADPDSDRSTFILTVVQDYLTYLRKKNILVPKPLEQAIIDELGTQVNTMLVKKIYGCLSVSEFLAGVPVDSKKKAKTRYKKIAVPKL